MRPPRRLVILTTAVAATLLAVLPAAVALDFGGVLWWTQYVAALAIVLAFILATPSLVLWWSFDRPRHALVMTPLAAWWLYSWLQTVRLSPSLVAWLSPGSYSAYTDWLQPILPSSDMPTSYPISIAPDLSSHAVAVFAMIVVFAWTSLRVFNSRARLIGLLSAIAITGAMISVLGIVSLTLPELKWVKDFSDVSTTHFGTFINRNNAALTLNFGLAASFGLLGWRLSALTGQEIDGDDFEFGELFALASDRDSIVGLLCAVLCIAGLLVCGSRGGLGAAVLATTISFGWIRRRKGIATIPVAIAVIAIAVAILVVPLQLNLESIRRLQLFSSQAKTLATDTRFSHWPEGFETAIAHLPAGSGLSTYAYAYLPYQNDTPKNWFVHADNLWLELFVEQGIVGIAFVLCLLLALVWCLTTISETHDALDHGIRITGWFCLVAVIFSQTFDFGLILPANLMIFVLLMAAMVSRSADAEVLIPDTMSQPSLISRIVNSRRVASLSLYASPLVLLVVVAGTIISLPKLHDDSQLATRIGDVEVRIAAGQSDSEQLRSMRSSLLFTENLPSTENSASDAVAAEPARPLSATELTTLAQIDHRLARLSEVQSNDPKSVQEARELYSMTSPTYRRLVGRDASTYIDGLPTKVAQSEPMAIAPGYKEAARRHLEALKLSPLDPTTRGQLLSLDFALTPSDDASDGPSISEVLIDQLGQLHRAHPTQLRDVAMMAAQTQLNDIAERYWNQSLVQSPHLTVSVMRSISAFHQIDLLKALPNDPTVMRMAVNEILTRRISSSYPQLEPMVAELKCEECESIDEKSRCLQLTARAHVTLGQVEKAAKHFAEAVALTPSDAPLRLDLIATLRKIGDRQSALQQARMGRQIDPADLRFDNVIKQMAAIDLEPQNE